jgi:hypothetical protein
VRQAYDKLEGLLDELFQFDREDLDFGIYRIMNQKRAEVSKFLDHDLLPQVRQAFGIRNLQGDNDPKIEFHSTIKEIEDRLGDPRMVLNSFIVSNTPFDEVAFWGYTKDELEEHHVLFQSEDRTTYIRAMLDRILSETAAAESVM